MSHNHGTTRGKKLAFTIFLNLTITLAQVVGGLFSGSLSLLSDAAHNFSDVIALIISWIADKLSKKSYSNNQTYGFKRAEVIAATINVVTIIIIATNILIEGVKRFSEPVEITGMTVILLAGLSILVNGLSVLVIKKETEKSMNMKSAYLHLFSDMLTSIAVLVGGILMYFFNLYWIDGIISIIIAAYLIVTSLKLLKETLSVLMQFTPDHLDIDDIKNSLESFEWVRDIHHVHVWQLTDDEIHFQAHISFTEDVILSVANERLDQLKRLLHDTYDIEHSTLEPEFMVCDDNHLIVDER